MKFKLNVCAFYVTLKQNHVRKDCGLDGLGSMCQGKWFSHLVTTYRPALCLAKSVTMVKFTHNLRLMPRLKSAWIFTSIKLCLLVVWCLNIETTLILLTHGTQQMEYILLLEESYRPEVREFRTHIRKRLAKWNLRWI
jgi:hypothetical protein